MGKLVGLVTAEIEEIKKSNRDTLVCHECGKEYKTQEGLDKHLEKHQ